MGARVGVWVGLACLLTAGAASAVSIETVPVGNINNAADTRYPDTYNGVSGFGSVGYTYNIGKYEVTAGQYCEFLNAVAKTDTYALYNPSMANASYGSGITRSGSSGSYTYSVDLAFVNRPVNCVSFWDSCRFANWLHNGQPSGPQSNSTTEDGAYTLTPQGMSANTVTRNGDWRWAVASEDEWYKAAYHKNDGVTGNYFDYPTSSNSIPGWDLTDASGNNANYWGSPHPIQSPFYTTVVGEFQNSDSPYGTFDQGGNVYEWNEAVLYGSSRGLRGGSFYFSYGDGLHASYRSSYTTYGDDDFGFRVVQVPEPTMLAVLAFGGVGMLVRRRGLGR